jgi:hypothetical protein
VQDNTLDTTTSLTLVGQNFLGYGTAIADNFVRLLENAANSTSPTAPLVGQLWYDTAHSVMKVWSGTAWATLAGSVTSVVSQTGAITLTQLVQAGLAPLASPSFTGVPQAPTAANGTSNNQIATTSFVTNALGGLNTGVVSVIGQSGVVTLQQLISGGVAPIASPTFTGIPCVPTAATGTNSTQIASTAFVQSQISAVSSGVISVVGSSGTVTLANLISGGVAPIASPSLTGTPQCPTAASGTSSNQIASTAFVAAAVASIPAGGSGRSRLSAAQNFYVASNGNDANNGLTVSTAFRTLQQAWNTILYNYDLNGYLATVNVADGTYAGVVCSGSPAGTGLIGNFNASAPTFGSSYGAPSPVNFISSSGNASRCIISTNSTPCFLSSFGAQIDITSMTLTATGGSSNLTSITDSSGNVWSISTGAQVLLNGVVVPGTANVAEITYVNGVMWQLTTAGNWYNMINTNGTVAFTVGPTTTSPLTSNNPIVYFGATNSPITSNGSGLVATTGGYIGVYSCIFGVCGNSHMEAYGGLIGTGSSYQITGNAVNHYYATRQGHINANNTTVTISNSPTFSTAFATSEHNSLLEAGSITFSGSAQGNRYLAQLGGLILTNGSNASSYFPGSVAGTTTTNGQYQ